MGYDHLRIKSNAKLFYKYNTGDSILVSLILAVMPYAAGAVLSFCFILIFFLVASIGWYRSYEHILVVALEVFFWLGTVAGMCCFGVFAMGVMDWFRRSIYGKVSLTEMFRPFGRGRFWSSLGTFALMWLYIFLWSMLLWVPGIIKAYSYSMTMYIKAENPEITPSRAIELSILMTDGHKGDLFYLHLSFLGWLLLSAVTYNILGIVYVYPYFFAAQAFAYEEIKADAAARGVIDIREISTNVCRAY